MPVLKKTIVLLLIPLAILMLLLSIATIFLPKSQNINQPNYYTLKDCGGCVALFKANSNMPIRTYPEIFTNLLPFEDMVKIKNGITVSDEEQLKQLILKLSA